MSRVTVSTAASVGGCLVQYGIRGNEGAKQSHGYRNCPILRMKFVLAAISRAFSGNVGTGFPQKMRQIKNLHRFPIQLNREAV
jgi:hypothetical protein